LHYILLYHHAYGLWIYDLINERLHNIFKIKNYPRNGEIIFFDWYPNSEKILIRVKGKIILVRIDEFLENYKRGINIR
jgi:hypothetical protein